MKSIFKAGLGNKDMLSFKFIKEALLKTHKPL
ncbi:MAG: hypothetical protein ACJAUR_000588 [Ulvibacter sp.]|jgi:hypothetical protein